jgi:hypothetical protein
LNFKFFNFLISHFLFSLGLIVPFYLIFSEADSTKENWERYYWDAMKKTFGFGSFFV